MACPPTKRLRGLNHEVVTAVAYDDPFGDEEGFTQDDLDEIDIIASQAITSASAGAVHGSKPETKQTESTWLSSTGQSKPVSRATIKQSRENTFGFSSSIRGNAGIPTREPLGNRQQQVGLGIEDSYSLLEAQHAELKKKLKEVEEEIVLKSGEIRVLRDSLKAAQQEKEAQRQNHILLETQRQKQQSDKEKELNRKVQSLQSELQFKEAEMNEMKSKLHSSDRNRMASPLSRNSPKVLSTLAQLHHGSGNTSSSPTGNGFITKETFGAHVPSRTTPVKTPMKTPMKTRRDADRLSSSKADDNRHEITHQDPFISARPADVQHQGGVLLGLLLQPPLSPSSLSLSHLLSMSLTDINQTSSALSAGFLLHSAAKSSVKGHGSPSAALSPLQSLALTGLNRLSQSQTAAPISSRNNRSCPGAVLLLPLLDLHLSRLCQALDSLHSSSADSGPDPTAARSLSAGCAAPTELVRLQENGLSGFSVVDTGLASLRILYLLLAHSDEVVETVLLKENQGKVKTDPVTADVDLCSQNVLLQSVLQLCEVGAGGSSSSSQKEALVLSAMRTLCVLIQNTPQKHTDRLQCVLQVVCACLTADRRLQMVSECLSVLMSVSDHQKLAQQLRSQHDPCVFLKLLQYIRIQPDSQATKTDWTLLNLKVVRLLSRLVTQRAESWATNLNSSCQCNTELVQTVVIVFHRQWLDLRGSQEPTKSTGSLTITPLQQCSTHSLPWCRSPAASLLRECLLLLHWLLLHHSSFSESCRPLLHMYDQVIPTVRDTLRKIPDLSESEELALEEICRSEGDDTDDMETDNGS